MKNGIKKVGNVEHVPMLADPNDLRPAPWNPEIRIQLRYLGPLRESMRKNGFWDFKPIIVSRELIIADGHRRWTAAKLESINPVPIVLVDQDADALWSAINGTVMGLTGGQAMQAVASGLQSRPAKFEEQIARLEQMVGHVGIKLLGQKGISPYIITKVSLIVRYLGMEEDQEFCRKVLFWLTDHRRMGTMAQNAVKNGIDPDILRIKIQENSPLTMNYG